MKGTKILINGNNPHGRFEEFLCADSSLAPGMVAEIVPSTEPVNGRYSVRRAGSGGGDATGNTRPIIVMLEDDEQGVSAIGSTYTSGYRCFGYWPLIGDELNMLIEYLAGTTAGDKFAIGNKMMVDAATGYGKLVIWDSNQSHIAPFQIEETVSTALTADTLVACKRI